MPLRGPELRVNGTATKALLFTHTGRVVAIDRHVQLWPVQKVVSVHEEARWAGREAATNELHRQIRENQRRAADEPRAARKHEGDAVLTGEGGRAGVLSN